MKIFNINPHLQIVCQWGKTRNGFKHVANPILDGWEPDPNDPNTGDKRRDQIHDTWQYLVDTGDCWKLQGWYGRSAQGLIEQGIIKPKLV